MDKVVDEIRYQFVVPVRIDYVEAALPNSRVPNWLLCQNLKTLCDFISSFIVHRLTSHLPKRTVIRDPAATCVPGRGD